jgi:hypothetical protein
MRFLLAFLALLLLAGGSPTRACVPPPSGLVSWWTGDGAASDSIGGNDGTSAGGVTFHPGKVGRAFWFDGIDDEVALGNPQDLHLSGRPFSVDAWVRFSSLSSPPGSSGPCFGPGCDMALIDKIVSDASGPNRDGWRLFKQSDDHIWFCLGGGSGNGCIAGSATTLRSKAPVNAAVWYHVAAVRSDSAITLYLDGVVQESKPLPAYADTDAAGISLGRHTEAAYTSLLNGSLDEIEIHDRALAEPEIRAIVSAGSAGKCRPTPVYDLGGDWSEIRNPSGVWTYREGTNPLPHVSSWEGSMSSFASAQPGWARSESSPSRIPFWFRSSATPTFAHDWLPGDVVIHSRDDANGIGSGTGNVIWTSPLSGVLTVHGALWMGRDIGRSNQWSLWLNQTLLSSGSVSSGDPYSRADPLDLASGSGGSSALVDLPVSPGDVLMLALEKTSLYGDFVGVELTITAEGESADNCPYLESPNLADTDSDGRGDACECTDQNGDGLNSVSDIVAINQAIFNPVLATPLCDGNGDGRCDVNDIIAANIEIYSPGNTSTCSRQPVPGP